MNSGDTAWILASSALVLLMTPGLAFFYGGLVRRKNVTATIMHSLMCMGLVGVVWVLLGLQPGFQRRPGRTGHCRRPAMVWPGRGQRG